MYERNIGDADPRRLTLMTKKDAPLVGVDLEPQSCVDAFVERGGRGYRQDTKRNLDVPRCQCRRGHQTRTHPGLRGKLSRGRRTTVTTRGYFTRPEGRGLCSLRTHDFTALPRGITDHVSLRKMLRGIDLIQRMLFVVASSAPLM